MSTHFSLQLNVIFKISLAVDTFNLPSSGDYILFVFGKNQLLLNEELKYDRVTIKALKKTGTCKNIGEHLILEISRIQIKILDCPG